MHACMHGGTASVYYSNRAINSELKTKSSVFQIYGATPQGVFELIRNKWWAAAISYLVALLLGGIITKILFG